MLMLNFLPFAAAGGPSPGSRARPISHIDSWTEGSNDLASGVSEYPLPDLTSSSSL
jgi:hypothetical protein